MTDLNRWTAWLLHAALVALLAACASAPPPVLLTLPPAGAAPAATPAVAPASVRVLAVSRPEIPEYLVARRVRYRAEASIAVWLVARAARRLTPDSSSRTSTSAKSSFSVIIS